MTAGTTRLTGLVVATLVAAAGLVGLSTGPAAAAQCSSANGVSVVVDFDHGAGAGIRTSCVESGGGKYADAIFQAGGFPLTYVTSQPGFVCQVSSKPAGANCSQTPPSNAYWGLFWAKKGATSWTYSTLGVGSLKIPAGGAVAFAFQDSGTQPPGQAPSSRASAKPTPEPTPAPAPTKKPTPRAGQSTTAAATGASTWAAASAHASAHVSASAAARASASRKARARASSASASVSPSVSASSSTETLEPEPSGSPSAEAAGAAGAPLTNDDGDGGLPLWVPGAAIVLLGAATGGALWWRRRTGAV